ncbi:MAG TPA: hypothetical protein VIT91_13115 [Chthoniobacterales bacterium]
MTTTTTVVSPVPTAWSLGTAIDPASGSEYEVTTTGTASQNSSQLQFHVTTLTTVGKTTTRATNDTTLRTGKSKTVGQVKALLSTVFSKFLNGVPPGTILGKLGAVEKGGEVLFVAESPEVLRFDFINKNAPASEKKFSRADVTALAGILAQAPLRN